MDMQNTLNYIRKACSKMLDGACVRISAEANHPIFTNMNELILMYPTLVWSKDPKKPEDEIKENEEPLEHEAIIINKDNIVELVISRIKKEETTYITLQRSEELLRKVI